ncbi:amidase domain-containing protein [Mycobacteroides abscessus]|uniref:amidase domain-containing protein n=1 Tax=Mycobacteroides abscessus TaxID=36809 RepID=UPI000C257EE6|nr:amidase domain-containing protein [Mycobacteroides abscessus]PVB10699.1 amidase [Mycobacteroides abscessus]PVB18623.1 amidase [Mycobacteroides abscessus]RIR11305.1 amidase [Mycobacteroides abscessus]RIR93422.1 amidase [Mycobacteroides abscessus]
MAAIAPASMPTKSEIFNWSTTHLEDAATQWEEAAGQSETAFSRHVANISAPGGTVWTGSAATSAYDDAREAQDTVAVQASIYRECASIARRGAGDIRGAKEATVNAIQEAEGKGYAVSEDLLATDTHQGGSDSQRATRKAEAQQLTEFMRWHAKGLASTAAKVAGELQGEAAGLQGRKLTGGGAQMLGNEKFSQDRIPGGLQFPPGLSEERKKAIIYAEAFADGYNGDYRQYEQDCTNFVSQALRAGGFKDVGDGLDDWHHGDPDDWYYNNNTLNPKNVESETWYNAAANHDYFTQHSGLGETKGVVPTPGPTGYDPLAPSKAGLTPGDLIYYRTNEGKIDHVAMYVGNMNGVDVVDQHADPRNVHDDWWPNTDDFWGGPAQVEFVHVKYPGE